MRGDVLVRCGGRAGETDRQRCRHRAPVRPNSQAHRRAAGYPIQQVDIAGLAGFASLIHVDPARVDEVHLTAPILIAPVPELGSLVIDGWHRVHRALRDGVTLLPARMLSEADEKRIRIHPAGTTGR
jgi:hypothetical protein